MINELADELAKIRTGKNVVEKDTTSELVRHLARTRLLVKSTKGVRVEKIQSLEQTISAIERALACPENG